MAGEEMKTMMEFEREGGNNSSDMSGDGVRSEGGTGRQKTGTGGKSKTDKLKSFFRKVSKKEA